MKTIRFSLALGMMLLLMSCGTQGDQQDGGYDAPARFKISDRQVTGELDAFAATAGAIGNSLISTGSGFEPVVYRNKYTALAAAKDRVVVNEVQLSNYDTLREGALDGADVHVYRLENGRFRMVRESRIPEGGFHVSGWLRLFNDQKIIPAGTTHFDFRWDNWNRQGVKYYFTVRAVDYSGNYSAPSNVVAFERPLTMWPAAPDNTIVPYRTSKLTLDTTPPSAPTGLRGSIDPKGTLKLEWNPVSSSDAAGYVVYRSDYPPEAQKGYYFDLDPQAKRPEEWIKAGDMVIVSKKFYSASRGRINSNRVWGAESETSMFMPRIIHFFPDEDPKCTWELVKHKPDTPVDEPGETYLKLILRTTNSQALYVYNTSGTSQYWYPVLETVPYKVEVWLRSERPSTVEFKVSGYFSHPGHMIAPITFQTGPVWKKYVATFVPPTVQRSNEPNQMGLVFDGPGVYSIDNFRVYRADAPFLDFSPQEYERLKESGISALRTHAFIKTKFRTYDMDHLTNPGGVIEGTTLLNTLPQTLRVLHKARVRPWLQIEPHMSPDEWQGLVEYLAAPYDPAHDSPQSKPWAYKRYMQGQQRPWTDEFDKIYFELGNETWNGMFAPWTFGPMTDSATGKQYSAGEVYGLYQEFVIDQLKSSPYWKPAGLDKKISFVIGGWADQGYGRIAATASPSSDYMTIGAYIGGWDQGEGPARPVPSSLSNILNQVSQSGAPEAERHEAEVVALNKTWGRHLHLGTYEAGPGYAMNGLNGAKMTDAQVQDQEKAMKSLAAGTATIDNFLTRAYDDFSLQNFFTFGSGLYWTSHAKWYQGGQDYPSWKQIALFDNVARGSMLRTDTLSVPTMDLQSFDRRKAVKNAPLVAVYAIRKGARYCVYVISRKVPDFPKLNDAGYTPVTLELPFNKVKAITLYRMAGDPAAGNVTDDEVKIDKVDLPVRSFKSQFRLDANTGATARGVEPASTYLYVFDGAG